MNVHRHEHSIDDIIEPSARNVHSAHARAPHVAHNADTRSANTALDGCGFPDRAAAVLGTRPTGPKTSWLALLPHGGSVSIGRKRTYVSSHLESVRLMPARAERIAASCFVLDNLHFRPQCHHALRSPRSEATSLRQRRGANALTNAHLQGYSSHLPPLAISKNPVNVNQKTAPNKSKFVRIPRDRRRQKTLRMPLRNRARHSAH